MSRMEWIQGYRRISFVGGGGKTTLIFRAAQFLHAQSKRVVITTTTHMMRPGDLFALPENVVWVAEENKAEVEAVLASGCIVFLGLPDPENEKKIVGVTELFLEEAASLCDVLLVEADGSRRRPVKIPRPWEPAILRGTDLTVAVLGMTGLEQPLTQCAYEPADLAKFLCVTESSPLTREHVVEITSSERGLRHDAQGDYLVVLNQVDTSPRREAAEWICGELKNRGIRAIPMRRQQNLAVILMAAGLSSRFGGDKIFAKLPDGRTLLEAALDRCEKLPVEKRILVYRHPKVEEVLKRRERTVGSEWTLVKNNAPELGISHSLQLGIQQAGEVDGWMFTVCDQPNLRAESMEELIRVWQKADVDLVSAANHGIPGNPKIFSRVLEEELEALSGDSGGREILKRHRERMALVEVSAEELKDIDTREEWDRNF